MDIQSNTFSLFIPLNPHLLWKVVRSIPAILRYTILHTGLFLFEVISDIFRGDLGPLFVSDAIDKIAALSNRLYVKVTDHQQYAFSDGIYTNWWYLLD